MPSLNPARARLGFWLEVTALEADHLLTTDGRLFEQPFDTARVVSLRTDVDLSERLDAFAARFARLQDSAGDKLLTALLDAVGEPVGSALDNLDRAARLSLLTVPSEQWLAARALRNRMVHEYIREPALLAQAVNEAHAQVPMLVSFVRACRAYAQARGLA